jgi:hypothetical protein
MVDEPTEMVDEPTEMVDEPTEVADEPAEVVDEPVEAMGSSVVSMNSESLSLEEKETYRKMSTQALKAVVMSKELVSDPSKLKKYELLQLLGAGSNSVTM